jgi:hypothetical protein
VDETKPLYPYPQQYATSRAPVRDDSRNCKPMMATEPNLTDRAGEVCTTLAACGELLDAVCAKVGVLPPPKPDCGPPRDNTLTNAIGGAGNLARDLLDRLRDLATVVGA